MEARLPGAFGRRIFLKRARLALKNPNRGSGMTRWEFLRASMQAESAVIGSQPLIARRPLTPRLPPASGTAVPDLYGRTGNVAVATRYAATSVGDGSRLQIRPTLRARPSMEAGLLRQVDLGLRFTGGAGNGRRWVGLRLPTSLFGGMHCGHGSKRVLKGTASQARCAWGKGSARLLCVAAEAFLTRVSTCTAPSAVRRE